MKIRILASASRDLIDGYRFYEKQAEGVGAYFLDSVYSDIDSLIVSAGMHSVHFGKYHRLLSKRFPFAVYYRVEGQTALVYAVLDCRRNPAWIRKRLSWRKVAKKSAPRTGTKTVETLKREEATRKNIPTAEYQSVLQKAEQNPVRVAYERRNRDLDPQLVWRGKGEQDWSDLVVHAPPLYIQEKVHPKALIDDLLRETREREHEADARTRPDGWRLFVHDNLTSTGPSANASGSFDFQGATFWPGGGGRTDRHRKTITAKLPILTKAHRLMAVGSSFRQKRYLDDFAVSPIADHWDDTAVSGFADAKVYVVQTNVKALDRCPDGTRPTRTRGRAASYRLAARRSAAAGACAAG